MPDRERRLLRITQLFILAGMVLCAAVGWLSAHHPNWWQLAFDILMLANCYVLYRFGKNGPAPDTLIRLFPKQTSQAPEKDDTQ